MNALLNQGYSRILVDNETIRLDEVESDSFNNKNIFLIVDRVVVPT